MSALNVWADECRNRLSLWSLDIIPHGGAIVKYQNRRAIPTTNHNHPRVGFGGEPTDLTNRQGCGIIGCYHNNQTDGQSPGWFVYHLCWRPMVQLLAVVLLVFLFAWSFRGTRFGI